MTAVAGLGLVVYLIFFIGIMGVSIYSFILFIKLATRGIRALDIYINEKTNTRL